MDIVSHTILDDDSIAVVLPAKILGFIDVGSVIHDIYYRDEFGLWISDNTSTQADTNVAVQLENIRQMHVLAEMQKQDFDLTNQPQ